MDNQEQNLPVQHIDTSSKKSINLKIIITAVIFLELGLFIGYITGKNSQQQ